MTSKMRRASIETLERIVKDATASQAEASRDRRLSLTMMNCIWARNTDIETVEPVHGVVSGEIPAWLRGTFYRVGPGIIQVGDSCYNHPFDMLSVVHKFTVGPTEEENTYRNKVVDSKTREMAHSTVLGGNGSTSGSSPDPFKSKLQRSQTLMRFAFRDRTPGEGYGRATATKSGFTALFQRANRPSGISDNCIDNFCFFGHDMYIMSDIAHMLKIQQDTLDTLAQVDIEEYVDVKMTTSHPHIDSQGTVWNIGTSFDPKRGYSYAVIKYEKTNPEWSGTMIIENARIVCRIPARHKHSPAYFHSFGFTQDYVVFVEQPLFVDDYRNGAGKQSD